MSDDFSEFISHLSENARTSLQYADSIARGYGSRYVGTEHLLLGILAQNSSVGAKLLADANVTLNKAELALGLKPVVQAVHLEVNMLSETAKVTLRMAWELAQQYGHDHLGTEHILHSLLAQQSARATVLLRDMGVDLETLKSDVETFFDRQQYIRRAEIIIETGQADGVKQNDELSAYGVDLTASAKNDELDPVIGRDKEVDRMITILSRRRKNNPLLIGEPGVGKTAIVEGLARRIVSEEVPDHLLGARIMQLDVAAIIAGTKYRGEFEERIKHIIKIAKDTPGLILFIDELHLLVGAGAAEGALDAANLLKPALARGELHLIGATTLDEYRKHIEKDAALERRFQTIIAKEPRHNEVVAILRGLRPRYEKHHSVSLDDETIEDAVYLADRYIKDRYMPDKAIDVLDEAAALVRVREGRKPSKLRQLNKEIAQLDAEVEEAANRQDFEKAAVCKTRMLKLQHDVDRLKHEQKRKSLPALQNDDLAKAVANMTGIPSAKVQKSEAAMLSKLEQHLQKRIIGQSEAVTSVARAVRRSRSGVASSKRPIGSFVFMGPTGVGKTELARVLAEEVFGSQDALVKIDMSEFAEKHTTSRLLGAPAGYIGHDEGGQLTDTIRRQPYSVVLFDEIEKAHPSVFHMLLQLLEDGKLTDASGRSVDFTNTIIILTSNLGSQAMQKESELGFEVVSRQDEQALATVHKKNAKAAKEALSQFMRPELINRFDTIVTFKALTRKDIGKIFDTAINELKGRIAKKGIAIKVKPSAKRLLMDLGYDRRNGARPLRRVIEDKLEHSIAEGILRGEFTSGSLLEVATHKKEIVVKGGHEQS
ncbi:MAG: ATP-dependent Clp protease ATP-binding subunit [Candidatus Saccharimonadales bacterium]